jgi:hypothetical protein
MPFGVVGVMQALHAIVVVCLGASIGHAESTESTDPGVFAVRRSPLSWSSGPAIIRDRDANRFQLGAGASTGWRASLDLHARYFWSDHVSTAARARFDLDATPRAGELELAYRLGTGKLALLDDLIVRTRLNVFAGTGGTRIDGESAGLAFAGGSFRIYFPCGFVVELGARESLAPFPTAVSARGQVIPVLEHRFATEVFTGVAIPLPR